MFLRNSKDLSELSGTQIVEVGKPGIPGLPNLSFQFGSYYSSRNNDNAKAFLYPLDSIVRDDSLKNVEQDDSYVKDKISVYKFVYRPCDFYMILRSEAFPDGPSLIEMCPANFIIRDNRDNTVSCYSAELVTNRTASIDKDKLKTCYTLKKYDGTIDEFKTYITEFHTTDLSNGIIPTKIYKDIAPDFYDDGGPFKSVTEVIKARANSYSYNDVPISIKVGDDIYSRSSLTSISAFIYHITNTHSEYDSHNFLFLRNIHIKPGLYDLNTKSSLFAPYLLQYSTGSCSPMGVMANLRLYKESLKFDETQNYITEITIENS